MTVPRRGSSIGSAMMPPSMEALANLRLLLAGDDASALAALRSWAVAEGASATVSSATPDDVAAVAAEDPPDAVVVVGPAAELVTRRLDPLGLEAGPPPVPAGG